MKLSDSNKNRTNLEIFTKELAEKKSINTEVYNKYFFINDPGKPDRSEENIKYYTDTLLNEIKEHVIKSPFAIYSLADAKIKFKKEKFYNYYYDGQKDSIYLIYIQSGKNNSFYYALMYLGKIVSLMPDKVLDNAIISWK